MDTKRNRPALVEQRRAAVGLLGRNSTSLINQADDGRQEKSSNFCVDTVIGCEHIGLRIEQFVYFPNVVNWVQRPYKSGLRKGTLRPCRVFGEHRDKRITTRRFSEPRAAASAYHILRRSLGLGLLPMMSSGRSLVVMGAAYLTPAGARSLTGQDFAEHLRSLGVSVADEPVNARTANEFWWVDGVRTK